MIGGIGGPRYFARLDHGVPGTARIRGDRAARPCIPLARAMKASPLSVAPMMPESPACSLWPRRALS